MKKILSLILCLTVSFAMMIPAFAAQEEPPAPEHSLEEIKNMYAGEVHVPPVAETLEASQAEPEAEEPQETAEPEETPETVLPEQEAEPETEPECETEALPEIDIEEILESEEFTEVLDEFGEEGEEIEDAIEDGEYEIIETPEEIQDLNLFELYGLSVFTVLIEGSDMLTNGLCLLALAPAGVILWVIPPVGAAYMIAGIPLGLAYTLGGATMIIVSPVAGLVMTAVIKSE